MTSSSAISPPPTKRIDMGATREEATVMLGADVGTIERNLGIGKSYFDRWGKQLKSDQENTPIGGARN